MRNKSKEPCCVCGQLGVTDAHVKDKSVCGNLRDHTFTNIIQMCYTCHYQFFDANRMGIKKITNNHTLFVLLNKENNIQVIESKCIINVKDEYIEWKNKRCHPQIRYHMLKKMQ